ncbi:XRE family transcriptional regulator [Paenibacillus sp. H1-7]|uniref:helix-turn-helix domain-containing protein n=1 Tax=Paenibacillus sp. H1-7 TaxID=2282849 RepID=UPI001EF7F540|nr:helix-turn-helix transcriptional regulator [Paenibacillus sp. H1-7]ULL14325.1 XRE family transcriptional regulator [Paenibacillus sp. H1-7]
MAYRPDKCLLPSILKERRLSARELSFLTGISETAISDYSHNRRQMTLSTAKTIAEALEIPIDDLYTWKQSSSKMG